MNQQEYSKFQKKAKLPLLFIAIVSILALFAVLNWGYLPFQYSGFDRDYNDIRKEDGRPIIEEHFVPKFELGSKRQVWFTPDSLKKYHIHLAKHYKTKGGELSFEVDYFRRQKDSLTYEWLIRDYYFSNDSIAYQYKLDSGKQTISKIYLSVDKGDSLLSKWVSK